MSFAQPKHMAARDPPARTREDPISGRLARAATSVSYDVSEGVPFSPGGTRRLWLVESDNAPRSHGVATVPAVSSASGTHAAGRNRDVFGGGPVRVESSSSERGHAYARVLRNNDRLVKCLAHAHGLLRRAFGGGRASAYVTSALRVRIGAQALKCVEECSRIGDELMHNWDDAWGSRLRRSSLAQARAERECERALRQTELALEEAEAAHRETEAYRNEMETNAHRIERAKTSIEEIRALKGKAVEAERRAAEAERKLAEREKRGDDVEWKVARARAESESETVLKELRDEIATLRSKLEKTKGTLEEPRGRLNNPERRSEKDAALKNVRADADGEGSKNVPKREETEASVRSASNASGEVVVDPPALGTSSPSESLSVVRESETEASRLSDSRGELERLEAAAATERAFHRKNTPDASETARVARAEARVARAESERRALEVACEKARQDARASREEMREVAERATSKQIELQEIIVSLRNELRRKREELEAYRAAFTDAGALRDVPPQIGEKEETSRALRDERGGGTARPVADDIRRDLRSDAGDGDAEVLEDARRRDEPSASGRAEFRSRAPDAPRPESRETDGTLDEIRGGDTEKNSKRVSHENHACSEVQTLRGRFAEADARVAVFAKSRDAAALAESSEKRLNSKLFETHVTKNATVRLETVHAREAPPRAFPVMDVFSSAVSSARSPFPTPPGQPSVVGFAKNQTGRSPRLEAARAEAERLVAEAESTGRQAFARMKSASAKFETSAEKRRGSGWAAVPRVTG